MKTIMAEIMTVLILLGSTYLYAHSYHRHEKKVLTETQLVQRGTAIIEDLVKKGKVATTWQGIQHESITKKKVR